MDLRQLEHFLAAVKFGSLRGAAERLSVSQPALTKSIRRLEQSLGMLLFERHSRGLRPTPVGEILVLHARTVQHEFKLTRTTLEEFRRTGLGLVRVGAGPSMSDALLPLATARLLRRGVAARVEVSGGLNDALLRALRDGELDFAVASMAAGEEAGLLTHEALFIDTVVIAAAAGHKLAGRRVSPEELLDYRWILPTRHVGVRTHLVEFFAVRNLDFPEIWAETDVFPYCLEVLGQTDLLGYVPATLLANRPLIALDLPGSRWQRVVTLSSWRRRSLSPACSAFAEELRGAARTLYP